MSANVNKSSNSFYQKLVFYNVQESVVETTKLEFTSFAGEIKLYLCFQT